MYVNYSYLINSNVSTYETIGITDTNSSVIIYLKYNLGEFFYLNDFTNNYEQINKTIHNRNIGTCTLTDINNKKNIIQTVRIVKLKNDFIKMVIRNYE